MRTAKRQKEVKYRKSFLPLVVFLTISWGAFFSIVYFIEPLNTGVIIIFFALLFIALFFTFSIIFANKRRGATSSSVLIIFLIFRYLGVGNIINLLLLTGIAITIELYLEKNSY